MLFVSEDLLQATSLAVGMAVKHSGKYNRSCGYNSWHLHSLETMRVQKTHCDTFVHQPKLSDWMSWIPLFHYKCSAKQ